MTTAFGPPSRSREGADCWEIGRSEPHVRICVDAVHRPDAVRVKVFNPRPGAEPVTDLTAENQAQALAIVAWLTALALA